MFSGYVNVKTKESIFTFLIIPLLTVCSMYYAKDQGYTTLLYTQYAFFGLHVLERSYFFAPKWAHRVNKKFKQTLKNTGIFYSHEGCNTEFCFVCLKNRKTHRHEVTYFDFKYLCVKRTC